MTQMSPDEDKLVRFLQKNRPLPPASSLNLEQQILNQISQEVRLSPSSPFWMIAGFIACALAINWGVYRAWPPQPQIASNPQEIEDFLVESWQGSVNYPVNSWDNSLLVSSDSHR